MQESTQESTQTNSADLTKDGITVNIAFISMSIVTLICAVLLQPFNAQLKSL